MTKFVLGLIIALSFSCKTTEDASSTLQSVETFRPAGKFSVARNQAQARSLEYVFYKNNPLPPAPTVKEMRHIEQLLDGLDDKWIEPGEIVLSEKERENFEQLLGVFQKDGAGRNDFKHFISLALRDTDGDGIHDFRIDDFNGKFFEGDVDLDGDGIRNIFDLFPYDNKWSDLDDQGQKLLATDSDNDGIPDINGVNIIPLHLRFADGRKNRQELLDLQKKLLTNHKIILVERNLDLNLDFAKTIEDVFTKLFASHLKKNGGILKTIRTMAFERRAFIDYVHDDGTQAMVIQQTGTMLLFESAKKASKLAQLGLLAHELGHHFHTELDFANEVSENRKYFMPIPEFAKVLRRAGWKVRNAMNDQPAPRRSTIVTWAYEYIDPNDYRYADKTEDEWAVSLEKAAESDSKYLQSTFYRGKYIIGEYSLYSPFEFFCENLMAYVIMSLEENAVKKLRTEIPAEKVRKKIKAVVWDTWDGLTYENSRGSPINLQFIQDLPFETKDLDDLTYDYVIEPIFKKNKKYKYVAFDKKIPDGSDEEYRKKKSCAKKYASDQLKKKRRSGS